MKKRLRGEAFLDSQFSMLNSPNGEDGTEGRARTVDLWIHNPAL
jgi:hypothetical protein